MSRLKKINITDAIAIYAAIISTITFIWTFSIAIIEKLPRLKVYTGIKAQISLDTKIVVYILQVKIINKSVYDIYIDKPYIKLKESTDGVKGHDRIYSTDLNSPVNYPISIKPREQYETQIRLGSNLVDMLKKYKNQNEKIKVEVNETIGKKFKSNKIAIKELIKYGEMKSDLKEGQ